MRALSGSYVLLGALVVVSFGVAAPTSSEVIHNHDFETGDLSGWQARAEQLAVDVATNETFNRNHAARIHGSYSSDAWITNSISQTIRVANGDPIRALGFAYWKTHATEGAGASAYVEARITSPTMTQWTTWTNTTPGWTFFSFDVPTYDLRNGDFESASLAYWVAGCDDLDVAISRDVVGEGDYAARMSGTWSNGWSFNQVYQGFMFKAGDVLVGEALVKAERLERSGGGSAWAVAGIKLENEVTGYAQEAIVRADTNGAGWQKLQFVMAITNDAYYVFRCMVCGDAGAEGRIDADVSFDSVKLYKAAVGINDGSFELGAGTFDHWTVGNDHLVASASTQIVDDGAYALRMVGGWSGWSFNQAYQVVHASSGDVLRARGRIYLDDLDTSGGWLVAGIKLESEDGKSPFEYVYNSSSPENEWLDMEFTANITNTAWYVFRAMVCGDAGSGKTTNDVYFDDLEIWRENEAGGPDMDLTVTLSCCGYSGGAAHESAADVYFDCVTVAGSSVGEEPATNAYALLVAQAAAIAAAPAEDDVPPVLYPRLNAYGYPDDNTNVANFAAAVEAVAAGWRFRYFTNDVTLTLTNTIEVRELGGYGVGFIEFDEYRYCARYWHTERGSAVQVATNDPYFALGTKDNSGAEFGNGPFAAEHTYVLGTPLANFPRRMVTHYDGTWPTRLNIVYPENLSEFDRSWDKYFALSTVATNGPAGNVKAVNIGLSCSEPGNTNLSFRTHEIHMGWADEQAVRGLIDYPNITYQDHNEVNLRAPWEHGLIDRNLWFMQQVPRGSATIEPLDLHVRQGGAWYPKVYEEYLFTWPNAASGVRSIFEDDQADHVPGPGSYHVGFKIGHQYGTNEFGEPRFPQVVEIRGNGYYRMTDYDGVMGGSFRPVAMDIFGIYQGREDAPIMPAAYARLVDRTSPTNEPDNSYAQFYMPVQSKTNHWLAGAVKVDAHFTPDDVADEGAYFELESDLYANRAVVPAEHGKLNLFAQVDMFWRGSDAINDATEGHDFDAVVVKKADGEWITHHPINPPTNIYHHALSGFASNDVVYLMQQDRGPLSYPFATEAPYRKVSTFELTMLDTGGRDLDLEIYEQHTISEINDNIVLACAVNEELAKGERVHARYRYRSIYAPGVTILAPNEPSGGESWSGRVCTIDFVATDGEDQPLQANIFFGNGTDEDWTLINTGELLLVPTDTHRVAYEWDVSSVPPGAYYIKVEAQRQAGGKVGFDVSDSRIQVGPLHGFANNGRTNETVVTNAVAYLGANLGFETGDLDGWVAGADHLDVYVTGTRVYEGIRSARMRGEEGWTGWSWNNLRQDVPCRAGEVLHVTGHIYIGALAQGGTNWVACGIKMEGTNNPADQAGVEFRNPTETSLWINVDFTRTAPVDGTDRLLLWVAGNDCAGADVFFDDIRIASTNSGTIVTNRVRQGYWEGDSPVDASGHNALSFWVGAGAGGSDLQVWAADAGGTTNAVPLTNCLERLGSLPQEAVVPWSAFGGLDRNNLVAIGFSGPGANEVQASRMRSIETPLLVETRFIAPPLADLEGLAHYNPGQDVIQQITIRNVSSAPLSGLRIQVLQEYAETTTWLDTSHEPHLQSVRTRRGDRLCGEMEAVLADRTIPAGGSITLTNTYPMPAGKLIDHTKFAIPSGADFYVFRNYAARAQLHLVVRAADGACLYDNDGAGCYSMDDDFDIDNDGLPDAWETQHGGDYTVMLPDDDPDGDGYDNLTEYLAGSDPNDPLSYPGHVTSYTLHLAYEDGLDLFPRAVAEQSNYTGVASCWMIASYLHGLDWTQSQDAIYAANLNDPGHDAEITPQSCASWMYDHAPPQFYFSARSRTNLNDALKESVYWMDYLPPGGKKTPVYILCGTGWDYKVVRGFQTDRPPYDGGYGVTTASTYTVYGLWLNDPAMSGLGYDVYASADELESIYLPSEPDGRRWLVAEPPQDAEEMDAALEAIDASTAVLAGGNPDEAMAGQVSAVLGGAPAPAMKAAGFAGEGGDSSLQDILPPALLGDEGFMDLFDKASTASHYAVNADDPHRAYVLAAGGILGPASTVYVLKLGTNGALQQATWDAGPSLYPPVPLDAAEWAARRELKLAGATLVEAKLVYDPAMDPSPFMPRWQLLFDTGGGTVSADVTQGYDLSGDLDGDGMPDGSELYAGTDPEQKGSVLALDAGRSAGGPARIVITWPSASGRRYAVSRSTDLAQPFAVIASGIAADPPTNEFADELPAASAYYRIEVE